VGNVILGDVTVLAVTGLNREAAIMAGPGVVGLASGGDIATLAARIEAALAPEIMGIISIGIAGALDPALRVGDIVIATRIALLPLRGEGSGMGVTRVPDEAPSASASASGAPPPLISPPSARGGTAPCHGAWSQHLAGLLPAARLGAIVGSSNMIVDAAAKAALHAATGALCVDMESHIAAGAAARHGLPFAALRFISDGADRALPKAAQAGMKPDGGMDIAAVLKSLATDPRQLPALIRTGMEAEAAFRALSLGRSRLGPALGFADVEGVHLA
jgi:adenosylhomocysteine nucleosidase